MTCGEALLHLLAQYKVDTLFGIPGTHSLELYRGIATHNLCHIQARHEQGAGFMADGYARVSCKPGVAIVISGPGVTNAADLSPLEQQHVRLCEALRSVLPADSIVMADMTQLAYTGSFAFPVEQPRRWFYAAGYCTLGCALPMAIGAKVAAPQQPVVTLVGDGGLLFTVQELATAVELGLSIPIVLWNNNGYGEIRDGMKARAIPPIGVNGRNPDFVALAQAFGGQGVRPASLPEFSTAVVNALETPGPTVIEVYQDAHWLTA